MQGNCIMMTSDVLGRLMAIRPAREPHPLTGTALMFDLAAEADRLMTESTWQTEGHNAKTLVKHPDFRVVLIALKPGGRMNEHKTDQCVTIHVLVGCLRLHLSGKANDLPTGALLAARADSPSRCVKRSSRACSSSHSAGRARDLGEAGVLCAEEEPRSGLG